MIEAVEFTSLGATFTAGLLTSLHCVGMCGGFVLALSQGAQGTRTLHQQQVLYFLGKTATYTLMGAIAGATGALLGGLFTGMQDALSIVLGIFLVVLG